MAKNKTQSVWTLIFSITAILISAGSLYFSFYVYNQSNKEQISITSIPEALDYNSHLITNTDILTTQWIIVFSNNGDKTLSITDFDLYQINKNGYFSWYTGLNQGVYDENGQSVSLPIDIESGKSKKVMLKLGLEIGTNCKEILATTKFKKGWISIKTIQDTLYKHNIDFFDNHIESKFYHDTLQYVKWPVNFKQTTYEILIKTAKGSTFNNNLKWIPMLN